MEWVSKQQTHVWYDIINKFTVVFHGVDSLFTTIHVITHDMYFSFFFIAFR